MSGLRIGDNSTPVYTIDALGSCNILGQYKIAGTNVLTSNTLGSGIVNSSLNSIVPAGGSLLVSGHCNISPNSTLIAFRINNNTLGSGVVSSSLTSVGTLTGLTVNGVMSLKNDVFHKDLNGNNKLYYESSALLTLIWLIRFNGGIGPIMLHLQVCQVLVLMLVMEGQVLTRYTSQLIE